MFCPCPVGSRGSFGSCNLYGISGEVESRIPAGWSHLQQKRTFSFGIKTNMKPRRILRPAVIANQSADWCGNPPDSGTRFRLRSLRPAVIANQSADWCGNPPDSGNPFRLRGAVTRPRMRVLPGRALERGTGGLPRRLRLLVMTARLTFPHDTTKPVDFPPKTG